MKELKEKIGKIGYKIWKEQISINNGTDEIIVLFQTYLKEHNYVQLDEGQSLPFAKISSLDSSYRVAQQDMLKANFKKVRSD